MDNGYILLHRKILTDWEWYGNANDTRLWIHCLLKANWKDGTFEGQIIPRGSFVTSLKSLATELNITIQQARTSLSHLTSTKEITSKSYSKYRVITINKYDEYQLTNKVINKQITSNNENFNKQITSNQQQYNTSNTCNTSNNTKEEDKEEINKEEIFDCDWLEDDDES